MKDSFDREIEYMRISVTDACNLRCRYCLPEGNDSCQKNAMSKEEVLRLVKAAVSVGIRHFKITGGEPLIREDCSEIIRQIKALPGVSTVTLTTNGVLLEQYARSLKEAGIDRMNVSLDCADETHYTEMTGRNFYTKVLRGIRQAKADKIQVRLNTVSLEETDAAGMAALAEELSVPLRFIELMPIGCARQQVGEANQLIREKLSKLYGEPTQEPLPGNGPAVYYRYPGLAIPVGFISAVHDKFCGSCNRIRVTKEGLVKPCLCYEDCIDIRPFLKCDSGIEDCADMLRRAILTKPASHCFDNVGQVTQTKGMSQIGG